MTVITTAVADAGELVTWETPGLGKSAMPRGEIIYRGTNTVAALAADDESVYQLTCTLPRNYAWKFAEIRLSILGTDTAVFDDLERGGRVLVTADAQTEDFMIFSESRLYNQSVNSNQVLEGVTNDVMEGFRVPDPPGCFFQPKLAAGTIVLTLVDHSTDTTTAYAVTHSIRMYMYTIEQMQYYLVHFPNLVVSA